MDNKQLREQLDSLARELESVEVDETVREQLNVLIAELEVHEQAGSVPPDSMPDTVRQMVSHFEVEHPTLTGVLNNILVSLGNMGV